MHLFVGLTSLVGSVESYSQRFDLLELRGDPTRLPSPKAIRRMRTAAPKLIVSLLIPPQISGAILAEPDQLAPVLANADALGARWLVLQTGPEVGPSQRVRTRLSALVGKIQREDRRIGWEPHGPWEEDAAREEAENLGVHLVQDLAVAEGGGEPVVYTRLRSLGPGASLRSSALEHLAVELSDAEEAYIVIEGRPSQRARSRIENALAGVASALDEGEDEDEDEDEESSEDPEVSEAGDDD